MFEELVSVLVPRSRLIEVYALLASPVPAGHPTAAAEEVAAETDGWTQDLIDRAYRESAERMRQVFDHLAQNPDRWVSVDELAGSLRPVVDKAQMRGVLGGFGHRKASRYGMKSWPCYARWDDEARTSYYRMNKERAEAFKAARSRA